MSKDKNEELQNYLNDNRYIQVKELMDLYSCSRGIISGTLRKNNVKPIKKFYMGKPIGLCVFYDKGTCEEAFTDGGIRQRECEMLQKENNLIGIRALAKIFERSENAMRVHLIRHKIKPAKVLVGQKTRVFYDKDQCLSLLELGKTKEEKLRQMIADDRYIQFKELASMYSLNPQTIRNRLWRNNVKPAIQLNFLHKSFAFYDKELCLAVIEGRIKTPRASKTLDIKTQQAVKSWIEDSRYVQVDELQVLWGVRLDRVWNILSLNKIKPAKKFLKGIRACFYSRASCRRARPFVV